MMRTILVNHSALLKYFLNSSALYIHKLYFDLYKLTSLPLFPTQTIMLPQMIQLVHVLQYHLQIQRVVVGVATTPFEQRCTLLIVLRRVIRDFFLTIPFLDALLTQRN